MTMPVFCPNCGRRFGAIEESTRICVRCLHHLDPVKPLPADDATQEHALAIRRPFIGEQAS